MAEENKGQRTTIFTDKQKPQFFPQSSQSNNQANNLLHEKALRIEALPGQFEAHWIAARSRVPGIKAVDLAAKRDHWMKIRKSHPNFPPQLLSSPSAPPHLNLGIQTRYTRASQSPGGPKVGIKRKTRAHEQETHAPNFLLLSSIIYSSKMTGAESCVPKSKKILSYS